MSPLPERLFRETIQRDYYSERLFRETIQRDYSERLFAVFRETIQGNYSGRLFREIIQSDYSESVYSGKLFRETILLLRETSRIPFRETIQRDLSLTPGPLCCTPVCYLRCFLPQCHFRGREGQPPKPVDHRLQRTSHTDCHSAVRTNRQDRQAGLPTILARADSRPARRGPHERLALPTPGNARFLSRYLIACFETV